jgi:myosin heavy subunit
MSPIGKIFVVANFGLACGFLFWASTAVSTNAEWKQKYDAEVAAHAATKSSLEAQASELQTQVNAERSAKESRAAERDAAQGDVTRLKEEAEGAKRANEQLRSDLAAIRETLDGYAQTIASLESSKDAAVAEARQLERERNDAADAQSAAEAAQADAEEALAAAQRQVGDLQASLKSQTAKLADTQAKLDTVVSITNIDLNDVQGVPDINGRVLQVDYSLEPGLVALNVGSKAGVKRGMVFQVYDGATYKGRVRVENVEEDMCSALVTGSTGPRIGQGDSAATRL